MQPLRVVAAALLAWKLVLVFTKKPVDLIVALVSTPARYAEVGLRLVVDDIGHNPADQKSTVYVCRHLCLVSAGNNIFVAWCT